MGKYGRVKSVAETKKCKSGKKMPKPITEPRYLKIKRDFKKMLKNQKSKRLSYNPYIDLESDFTTSELSTLGYFQLPAHKMSGIIPISSKNTPLFQQKFNQKVINYQKIKYDHQNI